MSVTATPQDVIEGRARWCVVEGDCLAVLPTLPAGRVDAVVTDPPYEITASGGGIGRCRQYLHDIEGFTDGGFDSSVLDPFENWMAFCALRQVPELAAKATEQDKRWMLITWNKTDPTPLCNGNYLPDTEYIVHSWTNGKLFGECREKHRFIVCSVTRGGKLHPNEKPLMVMKKLIRNASMPGGLILDPFAGSGTTGVAALQTGRRFIGIEIDPHYAALARARLEKAETGGPLFAKVQQTLLDGVENP